MSGRGMLRGANASPTHRMVTGRGGFFNHLLAAQQQRNLVTSNSGSLLDWTDYPLDDLALECIKQHLSSTESVFLTPISERFASVRGPDRYLSLFISGDRGFELIIKNKNGSSSLAAYRHLTELLFAELLMVIMDAFRKFQLIDIQSALHDQDVSIVNYLCVAVVWSKGPTDVRSFHLSRSFHYRTVLTSLPPLIETISPSLRRLKLECVYWAPDLVLAVGRCQQLRSLICNISNPYHPLPAAVVDSDAMHREVRSVWDILGLLPHLNSFGLEVFSSKAIKYSCVLKRYNWLWLLQRAHLERGDDWSFKSFLHRVVSFTLRIFQLHLHSTHLATLDFIISAMTSPLSHSGHTNTTAHVVIESSGCGQEAVPIEAAALLDWLRLTSRYRVIITLKSRHPAPTLEEIATIQTAADNDADIRGLDLPIVHNPEAQTFGFFGGGHELRLRTIE